ncbi:ABC transporter permease [Leucobacter weissii]|uniref:ABC transporter permease n=1 Tax=Leucobacter weissii TaxID=1983706 RepID=A0A939MM62_9MICO|nr:ABC transporter permease [Leucobacter weissii]MBO1903106.1 ABC transporter permease [Leucobacter weissii]
MTTTASTPDTAEASDLPAPGTRSEELGIPGADGPSNRRRRFPRSLVVRLLPPLVLAGLIIYFSLARDTFFTVQNFVSMGTTAGYLLAGALGLTLVVLAGSIDISVGATVLLTAAVIAIATKALGDNLLVALALTLVTGALIGAANGALTVVGRLPSFIVTLGTLSLFTGLGLTLLKGQSVSFVAPSLLALVNTQLVPGITGTFLIGLILFAISWFVTRKTRFGLYIYSLGANEKAANLAGVNAKAVRFWLFVISAVFAAISGLLLVSGLQAGGPTLGTSFMLDAIAAVAVGGTSLAGGSGGVERTFIGVLILTVLASGLNQLGVPDFTQTMIKGAVVLFAATLTIAGRKDAIVK